MTTFVLVGGSGFVGSATARALLEGNAQVVVCDRRPPRRRLDEPGVPWVECDLLVDVPRLPDGHVVVLNGNGHPRERWQWTLPLDIAVSTARLLPALEGRNVTLISSVEAYGAAEPPLSEDTEPVLPWDDDRLQEWCDEALLLARLPCQGWRVAGHCRAMVDADPTGRWTYGMAKRAQELLVAAVVEKERLTVLRLANVFGAGQERVITRFIRRALIGDPLVVNMTSRRGFVPVDDVARILLASIGPGVFNVASDPIALRDLAEEVRSLAGSSSPLLPLPESNHADSCGVVTTDRLERALGTPVTPVSEALEALIETMAAGEVPVFDPPLGVVVPPRPVRPDEVADRQQAALAAGQLKHGNRWSSELHERLRDRLQLPGTATLLLTRSGTEALRLAVAGTIGTAAPGEVAVVPSFTYPTSAEVLCQLGYVVRFADADPETWNLDPSALGALLERERVRAVVCVDTFGNPCDYGALRAITDAAGVPLLADSAAAIGSAYEGIPVGNHADAHCFSMSFAKVLSAGGAGGAVVFLDEPRFSATGGWTRGTLMDEPTAVAALDQLSVLDDLCSRRTGVARIYEQAIADLPGLVPQRVASGSTHSYVHWVFRAGPRPRRSLLSSHLARLGVETKAYFRALHLAWEQEPRAYLPVTESLDSEVLALPMSSELTDDAAESVALALRSTVVALRDGAGEEAVARTSA